MRYLLVAILCVVGFSANAEVKITEKLIKSISKELLVSVKTQDTAILKKYLYPGTKLIVDMDPSPSAGKLEITYEKYMALVDMSYKLMKNAEIHDEVISIKIDEEKNQGTIEEKTTVTLDMMGIKMRDVSISTTTYGVVNGEVKALRAEDELISSGPVQ